MICGIDPGVSGAIALFKTEPVLELVSFYDLPMLAWGAKGNKHVLAGRAFAAIFEANEVRHAYLELVKALPGGPNQERRMGATSAFNFGGNFHGIRVALEVLAIPYTLVTPERWKKGAGLVKAEKDVSRTRAVQLFPNLAVQLERKKDVGRAEAALIAYFGRGQ